MNDAIQHISIEGPEYFADSLRYLSGYLDAKEVGLVLVPQEGDKAGDPLAHKTKYPNDSITDLESRMISALSVSKALSLDTIRQGNGNPILIEPISGGFGDPIGYLWAEGVDNGATAELRGLANRIAQYVGNSKKSRLHEVVSRDFIAHTDLTTLLESVAETVKHGLFCEQVIVWVKDGNIFKSFGIKDMDLNASNSLVQRAYEGETISIPSLSDSEETIYYKEDLERMGINSFFLVPVNREESNEVVCIVGVFYKRIGGTTKIDLELVHYVVSYFEKLWTLYSENLEMTSKLEFFDEVLSFHDEAINCMVSFHEIKSIFQVLESQINSARSFAKADSEISKFLEVAKQKTARGLYLLDEYGDTFATAGALDEEVAFPDGDRVRKVDLRDYSKTYLGGYIQRCKNEGVELTYDVNTLPEQARLDLDHFELILDNYITNALYALRLKTHVKKTIHVTVMREAEWLRIEVKDNGPGIEPSLLKHVFTANVTTRKKEGGRGIGLAIVWKIGRRHERNPIVASEWGYGATFTSWIKPLDMYE